MVESKIMKRGDLSAALIGLSKVESKIMKRGDLCAALIGKPGCGKTTVYNKLCNTNHPAIDCGSSLTQEIRLSPVAHGKGKFEIIDTPGFGAKKEADKHAVYI